MAVPKLDYERRPSQRAIAQRRVFARPRPGSVTSWLIFLNVLVFVMDPLLAHWGFYHSALRVGQTVYVKMFFEYWGYYSPLLAVKYAQFWRFITFQFLHANFDHLVFNVIALASDGVWGLVASTARGWFARSPRRLSMVGGVGGLTMIGLGVTVAVTGRKD